MPRRLFDRRTYEIEFFSDDGSVSSRRVTSRPVGLMDPPLGPGDAWSVVRAADEMWDGTPGEWLLWPPADSA